MSEIPPDLPASAAQAGFQAREVAKERDARRVGQQETARRQIKSIDEASSTVETTDEDVAVFADAEGSGGKGREPAEEERESDDQNTDSAETGITKGQDGRLHLDLEA